MRRRIAHAMRAERGQFFESFEGEFAQSHFAVQSQGGLELFGFEPAPGQGIEAVAQGIQLLGFKGQTRRHRVATVAHQQVRTIAQRGGQVESFDAAARAAPILAVTAEDEGGTVKGSHHARGDDSDDANVPKQLAFDDDVIRLGVEFCRDRADDFVGDGALDFLALPVAGIQFARQRFGGGKVSRQQQLEGRLGILQSPGGI